MEHVLLRDQIIGLERHARMFECTATPHNIHMCCLHLLLQTNLYSISKFISNGRLDLKAIETPFAAL